MFRFIGIIIVLGIVGWLMTRQVDDARDTTREIAKQAGAAGIKVDPNARPSEVAVQIGKAVEAQAQGSKARVDDAERSAGE